MMKNFHQNLLVVLALGLCGLCVYQWYVQGVQRGQIERLNQFVYEKSAAIQGYTNSIRTLDQRVAQMDDQVAQLKASARTNQDLLVAQRRELNQLAASNDGLTNKLAQYKDAVASLEAKLKDAYAGIEKQNAALKELAAQRDEFVQKLNDSVRDRNQIANKYNELAKQVENTQAASPKQ